MSKAKAKTKGNYVLESKNESERLDKQSRMKAFDFKVDLQFLEVSEGQRILDAGCGSGIVSDYLTTLAPGVQVTGWDASAHQIQDASTRYGGNPNLKFAQKNLLDAESMIGGGERFDVVVVRYVLRHVKNSDAKTLLQNLNAVLKPGGTLYCVDVEGLMAEVFPSSPFLKESLAKIRDAETVDFNVARKLPSLLMAQGFQSVDWRVLTAEFRGEELAQEIENLEQSMKNARGFVMERVGGEKAYERLWDEYFSALRSPGFVHFYSKVVAIGTKPAPKLKIVT